MLSLRTLSILVLIGSFAALAACQTGTAASSRSAGDVAPTARATSDYALGVGDQIKVTVFGQPDLSGQFEVDGAGAISMPLIGQVEVLGQTTPNLEQTITTRLADGYLVDPKVSTEVINYRPFYILGEISSPGKYPYSSGLSIMSAVASAGGFTYRANKKVVYIRPAEGGDEITYQLNAEVMVQPGDMIRIGERIF